MSGHPINHPSRAYPVPTVEIARRGLALSLSLVNHLDGADLCKAGKITHLPLMDVALDGMYGVEVAEKNARRKAK